MEEQERDRQKLWREDSLKNKLSAWKEVYAQKEEAMRQKQQAYLNFMQKEK